MFSSLDNFRPLAGSLFSRKDDSSKQLPLTPKVKLYRSARLDKISKEDLEKLRTELGIRSVIDLRSPDNEYERYDGDKLLDKHDIVDIRRMEQISTTQIIWAKRNRKIKLERVSHYMVSLCGKYFVYKLFFAWHFTPTQMVKVLYLWLMTNFVGNTNHVWQYVNEIINTKGMLFMYKRMIDFCGIPICAALQLLNKEENIPAIICCHAGKDRTGILSALILSMCGFERGAIVHDYQLTEVALPADHSEMQRYKTHMRGAPRFVMDGLLRYIDAKYGSVPEYLVSIGFSAREQQELKQLILYESKL